MERELQDESSRFWKFFLKKRSEDNIKQRKLEKVLEA
jgi:hypothetical protein